MPHHIKKEIKVMQIIADFVQWVISINDLVDSRYLLYLISTHECKCMTPFECNSVYDFFLNLERSI
jgi:hypothetical protein